MADKIYTIAVATTDGEMSNTHFGRADKFYIYDADSDGYVELREVRHVEPICKGGYHYKDEMQRGVEKFADCGYVIAAKIGEGAAEVLSQNGIKSFEIAGYIYDVIDRLIEYEGLLNLFEI